MPPRRISGPYSPLQELERRLTEASFHPEELASILNMANNGGDHQPNADGTKFSRPQDVVDSQPSTPQDSEALWLRTGPARWSARWHRASKAAAQPSSRAEIGRSRAPTLPALPRFPSLPDFEAGTCGDQRLSRMFSLNAHRRDEKSLPQLPVTDGEDNAITGIPHNRGNSDQRSSSDNERNNRQKNEGKDVQTNARGRIDLSTHKNANTNPIRPSRLLKRNVPRRAVTENPVNDTDRLNSTIVDGRSTYLHLRTAVVCQFPLYEGRQCAVPRAMRPAHSTGRRGSLYRQPGAGLRAVRSNTFTPKAYISMTTSFPSGSIRTGEYRTLRHIFGRPGTVGRTRLQPHRKWVT